MDCGIRKRGIKVDVKVLAPKELGREEMSGSHTGSSATPGLLGLLSKLTERMCL